MSPREIIDIAVAIGTMCEVDSWLDLKKVVLISIPSKDRAQFSTRDPKTKEQSLNKFEHDIVENYEKRTGIRLRILK
jgi:hypothetical protein